MADVLSRDAIQLLLDQGKGNGNAAQRVSVVEMPANDNRYLLVKQDGTYEFVEKKPDYRSHELGTMNDVQPFVAWASERYDNMALYFREVSVVLVMDHNGMRNDRALLWLNMTAIWARLKNLDEESFTQPEFVRFVRYELQPFLDQAAYASLLAQIRALEWSNEIAGTGVVSQGNRAYTQDIKQTVKSKAGEIPEVLVLKVPIFTDPAIHQDHLIQCALEIDAQARKFTLAPLADEMTYAMYQQMEIIRNLLTAAVTVKDGDATKMLCPVFHGSP